MPVRPQMGAAVQLDVRGRVAHYELLTEITKSPRASLWAAHSGGGRDAGRHVALRRVDRSSLDAEAIERLRVCGAIARRIRDPKVVAVLDVVVTETELAVVSEYIDGEPLRSVQRLAAQRGAALPIPVAMRIALDLLMGARGAADAFRSAYKTIPGNKVVAPSPHGAVSPETALVASFGETMLTDLAVGGIGISLPKHASAMRYWAPEQFDPSVTLDERADVFSVGVVLWELIANQPLFGSPRWSSEAFNLDGPDADAVIQKVRSAPIARLDAARRAGAPVPSKVADLVARALERDRAKRFSSAEEMISAIFRLDNAVAVPDEVVTALDRVARSTLEARRASLGQLAERLSSTRDSTPPESTKGTYRPPAPPTPTMPTIPKSPKSPLSMLVMGRASAQKPLRAASKSPAPTVLSKEHDGSGPSKEQDASGPSKLRDGSIPSAAPTHLPVEVRASSTQSVTSSLVPLVPTAVPDSALPRPDASPATASAPPKPAPPPRLPYRATPPPRASGAPAATDASAPSARPAVPPPRGKPPTPVPVLQWDDEPSVSEEDETRRMGPRWQLAPDRSLRAPDDAHEHPVADVAPRKGTSAPPAPAAPARSAPPPLPRSAPPLSASRPPKLERPSIEPSAVARPSAEPQSMEHDGNSPSIERDGDSPSTPLEQDGKGPFGWAPDDSTHMLDPVADHVSSPNAAGSSFKASVRAVVVGGLAAAALAAVVIGLSASRRTPVANAEHGATTAKAVEAPARSEPPIEPAANPSPIPATPPVAMQPPPRATAVAEPTAPQPQRDAAEAAPKLEDEPSPAEGSPAPTTTAEGPSAPRTIAPRPARPPSGVDRPKPTGNDQGYRPRGI